MVSRQTSETGGKSRPSSRPAPPLRAWFLTWRLLLTRTLRTARHNLGKIHYRPQPHLMLSYLRAPASTLDSDGETHARLAALGVRAFVAGALGLAAVSVIRGETSATALSQALAALAWALARLGILVYFARRDRSTRSGVITAWAVGLFPYVIGVTSGMRLIAFVLSAVYTAASLEGMGVDRTRSLVTKAFGAQALVIGLSWAIRALVALIALNVSF